MKERIAYEEAAKAYCEAVKRKYPEGTVVEVEKGGRQFRARVIDAGRSWWYEPGNIIAQNTETGKTRSFNEADVLRIRY